MKVATWNVNGIRARREQFLAWLAAEQPDVVCLQEIKASPRQLGEDLCELGGYWCAWHGSGGYSGVGLHVARSFAPAPPRFGHPPFDHENRVVTAAVGDLVFASVYVPNGGKDFAAKLTFLRALAAWAAEVAAAGRRLVLCGDLNVAHTDRDIHPKERKPGIIGQRPDERELFDALLGGGASGGDACGLVDVGRRLDPDNDGLFTWWAPWRSMRERNIGWRIDYVLASPGLAATAFASRVLRETGTSDHAPLVVEFAVPAPEPTALAALAGETPYEPWVPEPASDEAPPATAPAGDPEAPESGGQQKLF